MMCQEKIENRLINAIKDHDVIISINKGKFKYYIMKDNDEMAIYRSSRKVWFIRSHLFYKVFSKFNVKKWEQCNNIMYRLRY